MIVFESIQNHDNINQTGLKRQLVTIIDGELGAGDIKFLKFLCQDHIGHKTLEKIKDGIQIFNELERLRKIDTSRGEVDYLLESLCRCHRNDLIMKMGFNQIQVEYRVENGRSNFSPFRLLLFELAEVMETADYTKALFTLSSVIPPWKHDKIKSICDVLIQLERSGDLSPLNVEVLYKLLKMMDRGDLISKVRAYQEDIPLSITESKLFELSKVIARREDYTLLASALMIDYDQTTQIMQANPTNVLRVHGFLKHWFIELRNRMGTSPTADGLLDAFRRLGFTDAIEEYVRLSREPESEFEEGAQPTGGNTEIGYEPVEEGQVPRTGEIAMEPEYQGEGQIPPANTVEQQKTTRATPANTIEQQRPTQATAHSVQFIGNQLPLFLEEFQNSTASVNRSVNDIQGVIQSQPGTVDIQGQGQNKHRRTDPYMHEYMQKRVKMGETEDGRSRVVFSNSENLDSQQEQLSPGTHPSVRGVGNQTPTEPSPFYRRGTSSEVPVNPLVPRNDHITEEQSPGDIGLTAGNVSLSDRSSQEISSGDILLSITESKLVGLSEIIARREDWMQLASALMIDYDQTTQIMQANPTNVLRVHGILKHWVVEQRKRLGTSPSAEGLLKAFRRLGFTNAIEEYVRLSREPEAELEQGSENLAVQSEFLLWNRVQNFNVSSDFDPRMDPRIRKPIFQVDAIVRQMEVVAIDDSDMPFYKMNARPRGLAIIINNEHFHKIKNDQSSMGMPTRTGTNKDEEKLEYIWSKLDFGVQIYNDVDSTRMNQIMLETASRDHSMYDCLVVTILTHGILGHVYGADGRIVRISQLTSCVSGRRCPSLAGKPKLFFIQACQGTEKQAGHAIETDAGGSMPDEGQDLNVNRQRELIPDEADFLLGYATVPGYVSYRSRSQGSWYINELTLNLDKYADKHDLLSILIKVNEEVGRATATIGNGAYKQIPAPMITLRKRIIFR